MADQNEIAQVKLFRYRFQVCGVTLVGIIGRVHPLAIAMATEIQRANMEVGDEPRRKEIEPMGMSRTAVNAQYRRTSDCTVVEVM
jgi:hypothetical protein